MITVCSLENMFSRNRFNGQHGAGVAPKGAVKAKVHSPKKRAPNPRVALVIRGKIHRLLQGSSDHHVPDSQPYYAGIEDEEERETQEGEKEHRSRSPKVRSRAESCSPKVPNGKGHGEAPGPPCVGEVELNREGCIRLPCTLQHKSGRSPANLKRISFEGDIPAAPEQMQPAPHHNPTGPDMNGAKFAGAAGTDFASPRVRPKRPFSAGDCLDYNFNRALPGTLLEEDEEKEEESSDVIEHILKELRGINKIQEEISDLRDYLTSVRGSVEEVSSCVDAVLLEIEGIRSSNKAGSDAHADTWSGAGSKDGSSSRRRPASAYGSLGSTVPKSSSTLLPQVCNERHGIRADLGAEESTVSPVVESVDHQDLEEAEDISDQSSDIPVGAIARKLRFGYCERQDDQDYPSTSSLSSGHSESDLEGPSLSHGRKQQNADDREEHWTNAGQPHSASGESARHRETTYRRGRSLEEHGSESPLCCEGAGSWEHYRGGGGYGTSGQCSTGSSEHLSLRSRKHYNSPASTSSREDWQPRRRRPQAKSGSNIPIDTNLEKPALAYEYSADLSYPQSTGYHSNDGHDGAAKEFDYGKPNDLTYTTDCHVDSYQEPYFAYEESSAVTWTEESLRTTLADVDRPFVQETRATRQSSDNRLPRSVSADVQAGGFNVKRIGRAVLDFSSALRGALCKIEVPASQNPGEEAEVEISMQSDVPTADLHSKPLCYEAQFEQTCDQILEGNLGDSGRAVRELRRHNTLDTSELFSREPTLEEANNGLTSQSTYTCQHPPCSDKIPPFPEEPSVCPDPFSSSTTALPPPYGLTEQPAECPASGPADRAVKAHISQCTTTESLSVSLSVDEPAELEEQGETEVELTRQPATGFVGDAAEPPLDISQMDERRLKCLRTFQQILREKRESRRNLTSMTMCSFSQDDFEPGSHCWTVRWNHLVF